MMVVKSLDNHKKSKKPMSGRELFNFPSCGGRYKFYYGTNIHIHSKVTFSVGRKRFIFNFQVSLGSETWRVPRDLKFILSPLIIDYPHLA
jgi:hypothetical protein